MTQGMFVVPGKDFKPVIDKARDGWRKIQEYKVAGAFTWVAPDLNNGEDYEIGALIIGGGGSGGVTKCFSNLGLYAGAIGGASGQSVNKIITVTPNAEYAVVVGAGGPGRNSGTSATSSLSGNNGGASSFDGNSILGGMGGIALNSDNSATVLGIGGVSGGQASDSMSILRTNDVFTAPLGGTSVTGRNSGGGPIEGITYPLMCFNPFDLTVILGAGGASHQRTSIEDDYVQSAPHIFPDGGRAGSGLASFNVASDVVAEVATSMGCGGGGCTSVGPSSNTVNTATSGAGADGAVLIYARGL